MGKATPACYKFRSTGILENATRAQAQLESCLFSYPTICSQLTEHDGHSLSPCYDLERYELQMNLLREVLWKYHCLLSCRRQA